MRRNAFAKYLLIQFIVVIAVMLIFKLISNHQVAATLAGCLFVGIPVWLMVQEYRRAGFEVFGWYVGVLQFWTLFALPILGLRIFNWGVPFEQLSFLGIAGPLLHSISSKSYLVMMGVTAWFWFKTSNNESKA